ncbi:ArnT family glycosyltransferase, partial [Acetobacter farinalis]
CSKRRSKALQKTVNQIAKTQKLLAKHINQRFFDPSTFYRVSSEPLETWDEARHIGSAYEMLFRHEYTINYWQGKEDYWNLKPSLSFFFIVLSLKLFGHGLLAARLPSLLCFLAMIAGLYRFMVNRFSRVEGLYAITLFSIWTQNVFPHSFRHSDADALYCTLYLACILLCLKRTDRAFCLACVTAALCFLTKSWHVLSLLPPLMLSCVLTKKSFRLPLKGTLCFLAPIMLWAGLRAHHDGLKFLRKMVWYDLLKRTGQPIEDHHSPVYFYLSCFVHDYSYLLWLLGALAGAGLLACRLRAFRAERFRSGIPAWMQTDMGVLGVAILAVFCLFSIARTRLPWYTYPAYPLLCVLMTYLFALLRPALKAVACGLAGVLFLLSFSASWQRENYMRLPIFYRQLQAAAYLPMVHVWKDGVTSQNDYVALLTYLPPPPDMIRTTGPEEKAPRTLIIRPTGPEPVCDGCTLISKGDQYDLFWRE